MPLSVHVQAICVQLYNNGKGDADGAHTERGMTGTCTSERARHMGQRGRKEEGEDNALGARPTARPPEIHDTADACTLPTQAREVAEGEYAAGHHLHGALPGGETVLLVERVRDGIRNKGTQSCPEGEGVSQIEGGGQHSLWPGPHCQFRKSSLSLPRSV